MKYLFTLLVVISLVPTTGCSQVESTSEDLFQKKLECGAMLEPTKEKHKLSDEEWFGDNLNTAPTVVEAVFYSPSINSCLEAYHYGNTYVIRDLLTGESVDAADTYDSFKAKIESLK